ncbi:amidohydrolase [Nocardia sp. NPDC051570]|uniref:amidohydrolase n=1 Tax=Nocardia sp. NPDC051570 TaxID=3364324 RepID=UPI0037948E5B
MSARPNRRVVLAGLGAAAAVGAGAAVVGVKAGSPSSARRSAATVLHNGVVYTGVAGRPAAQAVAVGRDGTILDVGTDSDIRRYLGRDTHAVDLRGGFVMAGLHDGHQHPIAASVQLHTVSLANAVLTIPQIRDILAAALNASADQEPDGWLQVSDWNPAGVLPEGTVVTRQDLDSLPTRRPIVVMGSDLHNAWVNSRALATAGITRDTPDPAGGTIVRDGAGEPTGLLKDAAVDLIRRAIPPMSPDQALAVAGEAFAMLTAGGVTTILDAAVDDDVAKIYGAIYRTGRVKVRSHLAYRITPDHAADPHAVLADLRAFADRYDGIERLHTGIAKVFLDGVMEYPAQTAALLQPYLVDGRPGDHLGSLYFDQDTLTGLALVLDEAGWQLHAHTIGDRAVRTALSAYEHAYQLHGDRDNRHTLAHVELIDPADVPRLARSKVLACLQLQWARTDAMTTTSLAPYLGPERHARIYPARSMFDAGVRLTGGTDWPVDAFGPWLPVAQAITRSGPDGPALHPEQGLSLDVSLRMHTLDGAYQLHQDHLTGTVEPGKHADLIHLDRDLLQIPPSEISGTKVAWTMIGGDIVHDATSPAAPPAAVAGHDALTATGAPCTPTRSHDACGH